MLKVLEKIAVNRDDFSDKEIALLAPYAARIAKLGQANTLERLWNHMTAEQWDSALLRTFYQAAETGQISSIKKIFEHADIIDAKNIIADIFEDDAVNILPNGKADPTFESQKAVILFAEKIGGPRLAGRVVDCALFGRLSAEMIEPAVELAKRYGPEIVERTIQGGGWGYSYAIEDEDHDVIKKLVEVAYAHGGNEMVLEMLSGADDEVLYKAMHSLNHEGFSTLIRAAESVGGVSLACDIIKKDDFALYVQACQYAADGLCHDIEEVASKVNDQEFAKSLDDIFTKHYSTRQYFIFKVDDCLEEMKHGDIKADDYDAVINECCRCWLINNFEKSSNNTFLKPLELWNASMKAMETVKLMIHQQDWESLKKFSELLTAMGEGDMSIDYALPYHEILSHGVSKTIDSFLGHVSEVRGKRYLTNMLSSQLGPDGYALHSAASMVEIDDNIECVKAVGKWLVHAGGASLFTAMAAYNDYEILREADRKDQPELIHYILQNVMPESKEEALEKVHSKWKKFENDEIRRTLFWQEHGQGNGRWVGMTGQEAPHNAIKNASPYKFKPKLYEGILPLISLAHEIEGNRGAEINAHKLSVMFSSPDEVDRYLANIASTGAKNGNHKIIHDACLFELPDSGTWSPEKWKSLLLKYGQHVHSYIADAPKIEMFLGDDPFPKTLNELKALQSCMSYRRSAEHPALSKVASKYNLPENMFNRCLNIIQEKEKTSDFLPDVAIDGADIGYPDFYMLKLKPNDPLGFVLGKATDCCQSVGEQGQDCAIHGMTSPLGGFYVWKRKTSGQITPDDSIVAQSWAWIGTGNSIVFDSFERGKSVHAKLAQPFIEHFAFQHVGKFVLENNNEPLASVRLGTGGYTPNLLLTKASDPAKFIDYDGRYYNGNLAYDSDQQYVMNPIDHNVQSNLKKKSIPSIDVQASESVARASIESLLEKFKEKYGIIVKAGIEHECFAVDSNGQASSKLISANEVMKDLEEAGIPVRFEDENTIDYEGQYEIATGTVSPLEAIKHIEDARSYLGSKVQNYKINRFDFSPLPFEEKESSSIHISVSLWNENGEPMLADSRGNIDVLLEHVVNGILEVQKYTTLLHAPTDEAFSRFSNSDWSPNSISASNRGGQGTSIRYANAENQHNLNERTSPEKVRIENRLASSDSSVSVVMAATLAGIDYALEKYVRILKQEPQAASDAENVITNGARILAVASSSDKWPTHALPANRSEALSLLEDGIKKSLFSEEFKPLAEFVKRQYDGTFCNDAHVAFVAYAAPQGISPHI